MSTTVRARRTARPAPGPRAVGAGEPQRAPELHAMRASWLGPVSNTSRKYSAIYRRINPRDESH